MNFYDDQSMTTRELFEQFFPGRTDVHRLLMEPITYANGSTLDDPAITYGIVFSNFMNRGVFTFEGGTDKLIGLMSDELEKNGVTICTRSKVDRIIVEKGRVRGVEVNGRTIEAKAVVSNSGITNTIDNLTDQQVLFPKNFSRRQPPSASIIQVARFISASKKKNASPILAICSSPQPPPSLTPRNSSISTPDQKPSHSIIRKPGQAITVIPLSPR